MNTQERDALNAFLQQLTQAQVAQKDPDADALITQALAVQPHAGYLLVQRAMQLDYVLQQTQAKVAELQAQLDHEKSASKASFMGDAYAWGRAPAAPLAASAESSQTIAQPPRPVAQPAAPMPVAQAPVAPVAAAAPTPWGSSVLGTVATTAAGVVAGSFLFQGIQNMMGHNTGGGFGGGGFGGNGFGNASGVAPAAPVTVNETTVNNYYSNDAPADQSSYDSSSTLADASDDFDNGGDVFGSDDSDFA
jgi:hypothetical protein